MEPFARTWLAFVTMERTFFWVPGSEPFGEQWCNCEFASTLSNKLSWRTTESGGDFHSYSIGAMTKGKAVGPDGIRGRSIQGCLSSSYWEKACLLCSNLGRGSNSQQFSRCSDCLHFQERWYDKLWELSLLSIVGKIFASFLACWLFPIAKEALPESQCGFRPAQGTVDMIFSACQIQEKCREQTFIWLLLID